MKRIIKLTERDLTRIVRRVINERQYLNEEPVGYPLLDIIVTIPVTKTNDIYKYYNAQRPTFTFKVSKGTQGNNLENFTGSIKDISINGVSVNRPKSVKDEAGNINGSFSVLDDNKKLQQELVKYATGQSTLSKDNFYVRLYKMGESGDQLFYPSTLQFLKKEYTPTQKESDLTRIVRRVINERQYLMEDDVRKVIPIEIAIPAVKNQKTGKLEPKSDTAYLSYFAKNEPGKNGMSSLMNETNFLALKFGDIDCSKSSGCLKTSKKDNQGNIVGSIYADQKLLNVLKTWVGQTDSSGSLGMKISTQGPEANTVIGSPKVYYKEIQPTQKD